MSRIQIIIDKNSPPLTYFAARRWGGVDALRASAAPDQRDSLEACIQAAELFYGCSLDFVDQEEVAA